MWSSTWVAMDKIPVARVYLTLPVRAGIVVSILGEIEQPNFNHHLQSILSAHQAPQ